MDVVIVGIAGGTGSGKTTLAREILKAVGEDQAALVPQDAYYQDQSHLGPEKRIKINYDHPDAFDTPLLVTHLGWLRNGKPIPQMRYDYRTHCRLEPKGSIAPTKLILVEGIMVLHDEALRQLMDLKIFVDTDADVRIIRRLQRDLEERGRTFQSVVKQYLASVRPMHQAFVEPSRRYADLVVSGEELDTAVLRNIVVQIKGLLAAH